MKVKTQLAALAGMASLAVGCGGAIGPAGTWAIKDARTPAGGGYQGTVDIRRSARHTPLLAEFIQRLDRSGKTALHPRAAGVYRLTWDTTVGKYSGLGLKVGPNLYGAFGSDPRTFGIVVYRVSPRSLAGLWTSNASKGLGTERAVRTEAGELAGVYRVMGGGPAAGSSASSSASSPERYKGDLAITLVGETYQLHWKVDGREYRGAGVYSRGDGLLTACWATSATCGAMIYLFQKQGGKAAARGIWTVPGVPVLGTENLSAQ